MRIRRPIHEDGWSIDAIPVRQPTLWKRARRPMRTKKTPEQLALRVQIDLYSDRIPPIELTIARLIYDGKSQVQIATLFGVAQPSVFYRIKRMKERLALLDGMPKVYLPQFDRDLAFLPPDLLAICKLHWRGLRRMTIAQRLGMKNPGAIDVVTRKLRKAIALIREAEAEVTRRPRVARDAMLIKYADGFELLMRTPRAQWGFESKKWTSHGAGEAK